MMPIRTSILGLAALTVAALLLAACDSQEVAEGTCAESPSVEFGQVQAFPDHQKVEVRFQSKCEWMAGTLYLPPEEGRRPAVVFVHGSGETPRLEYGDGWITTPLIEAGVAVLSYDKRGVGESEGVCCPGDRGDFDDLAQDALEAVAALRLRDDIDATSIGLLGVSQAGWIVPIVVERSPDVAITVLFSGSAVSVGEEILYSELTGEEDGEPATLTDEELAERLELAGPSGFDPAPFLQVYRVPGLWLFGARDRSQPTARSVEVLRRVAAEHGRDFTIHVFPELGHDVTHDPGALDIMTRWIANRVR